jgi:hypothetical protein
VIGAHHVYLNLAYLRICVDKERAQSLTIHTAIRPRRVHALR